MPQTKKEKQLKAWQGLIDQLKETGDLSTYAQAKHLRSLLSSPLATDFSLFFQEEIAQLRGYLKSAVRSHTLARMDPVLITAVKAQAAKFDELTVLNYREAVMVLWNHRMELINSKCPIGPLPIQMHWYEYNYSDLCRLLLPNQQSYFRARHDIEQGRKSENP